MTKNRKSDWWEERMKTANTSENITPQKLPIHILYVYTVCVYIHIVYLYTHTQYKMKSCLLSLIHFTAQKREKQYY